MLDEVERDQEEVVLVRDRRTVALVIPEPPAHSLGNCSPLMSNLILGVHQCFDRDSTHLVLRDLGNRIQSVDSNIVHVPSAGKVEVAEDKTG